MQCMNHTEFAQFSGCVLSWSTLLRLQVALQRNCSKRTLSFMHFPGLSCSGSGSWVLHKGTDSVGRVFVSFPGPRSSGNQVLGECTVLGGPCILITSLDVNRLPFCLLWGDGPVRRLLTLLWYSLNSLFWEWARLPLRLELFVGKFSLSLSDFFFSLWLSHSLSCYLTLAPSDCPQGIQAWSLP